MNMRKTVLVFGLVSGAASVGMMFATNPFIEPGKEATADLLGYSAMLLSALLVFFGVRSYREIAGAGRLTVGRGFLVGLLITAISTLCYIVAFQVMYFKVAPDFGERFTACMIERARAAGQSSQAIEEVGRQARQLKRLYDHPATNAALTFATSFPVGVVASLVSAFILRRKER